MIKNNMKSYGVWELKKQLGEGGFGEVHHYHNKYTGHEIATKRLKLNLKLKPDEIKILHKRWRQEYEWMNSLKTPFIVGAIQIDDSDFLNYLKDQNPSRDLPIIIMEFCDGGDLRQHLNKIENLNGVREHEVRDILRTLRYAIEYLHHECNIEHRDIKPENIVIQHKGNERLYKLTDFGYARDIPEETIAQSIVGTRHYIAPEVIDPCVYSKTVDYWSIGVMAYEIICGERPFIPHQHLIQIMTEIKKKPQKCIAIIQTECDRYQYEDKICPENHQSPIFKEKMEKWLHLALDTNYKTRGFDSFDNQLKFYTTLDLILETKVLTVYCLKTHRIYYYDIGNFIDLKEFFEKLSIDTGIVKEHIYLILPTNHPKESLSNIKNPMDFFVTEWCDDASNNPPVMLYVNDYKQCDFKVKVNAMNLSETFKRCMSMDASKCNDLPAFLLEHFEKSVHFILSHQQHLVECYSTGMHEHVLNVENDVVNYESEIDKVFKDTFMLIGRILQFSDTVNEVIKTQTHEVAQLWSQKADEYLKNTQKLKDDILQKVKTRFKSVLRHCNILALNDIYKTLPNSDIFKLKAFRQFLMENFLRKDNYAHRIDYCQRAFEHFIKQYENFLNHTILKEIRDDIHQQFTIFFEICNCIKKIEKYIVDTGEKLAKETIALIAITKDPILMQMQSLCIDGNGETSDEPPSSSFFMKCYPSLCNGETIFDTQTSKVIEESNKLLTLMDSSMVDNDDDFSMHVDIPATINNI